MHDPKTILLIDDDTDTRDVLADALAEEGYRVEVAANGREGLRVLTGEHDRPDAVLLDLMMPEMDGWMFRAEQRKVPALASIPVIAFTAYLLTPDAEEQLGASAILNKPIHLGDLLQTLEKVTAGQIPSSA
jgi:two-component system response regulator MprA